MAVQRRAVDGSARRLQALVPTTTWLLTPYCCATLVFNTYACMYVSVYICAYSSAEHVSSARRPGGLVTKLATSHFPEAAAPLHALTQYICTRTWGEGAREKGGGGGRTGETEKDSRENDYTRYLRYATSLSFIEAAGAGVAY